MANAIITFDDVVRSQLDNAVPVLQKHGFLATFFVCDWFRDAQTMPMNQGMETADLLPLNQLGFELGNHSVSHRMPEELSLEENRQEILGIEELFSSLHLPAPQVFAYPGGPYSPKAAQVLRDRHYLGARTTEELPVPDTGDTLRLPSFAINDRHPELFAKALDYLKQGKNVILTYHGIPDIEHPWVNVPLGMFEKQMMELHKAQVQCPTFSQFLQSRANH